MEMEMEQPNTAMLRESPTVKDSELMLDMFAPSWRLRVPGMGGLDRRDRMDLMSLPGKDGRLMRI